MENIQTSAIQAHGLLLFYDFNSKKITSGSFRQFYSNPVSSNVEFQVFTKNIWRWHEQLIEPTILKNRVASPVTLTKQKKQPRVQQSGQVVINKKFMNMGFR